QVQRLRRLAEGAGLGERDQVPELDQGHGRQAGKSCIRLMLNQRTMHWTLHPAAPRMRPQPGSGPLFSRSKDTGDDTMMKHLLRPLRVAVLGAGLLAAAGLALAQGYPAKPVTLMVPY